MARFIIYIVLVLSFLTNVLLAQEIHIQSRLDTNLIKIGEQTKLIVDVQYPKEISVSWPLMQDTIIDKLEIVDLILDTISTQKDMNHFLINYTITSFDSGYYVIPSQIIINKKTNDTLKSRALMFAVATLVLDTTKQNTIFDIKAPIEAPWTLFEFLLENYPYLLLGLLLIALILVALWFIKKQKNKVLPPVKKMIPKEAAHIVALRELEDLKEKKLWQSNRIKLYYIELSDIIRNYLENRFKVNSLEQTSQEIFDTIQRGRILTDEQLSQLKQILSTSDMAKFAKAKPMANENDLALKNAFDLIENTKLISKKEEMIEVDEEQTSKKKIQKKEIIEELIKEKDKKTKEGEDA